MIKFQGVNRIGTAVGLSDHGAAYLFHALNDIFSHCFGGGFGIAGLHCVQRLLVLIGEVLSTYPAANDPQ